MSFLYLVHHGDAVGPDVDPLRPLSERGLREVTDLAQRAAERGAKPRLIRHSGKARARQTAEAFWRRCNPFATFAAARGLQPSDPPQWIADELSQDNDQSGDLMLVGHFPHLPRLLSLLLSGDPDSGAGAFPGNGVVALEQVDGKWVERWRESPESEVRGPTS